MAGFASHRHLAKLVDRQVVGQSLKLCSTVWSTGRVHNFSTSAPNNMNISGIYPPIATPFNDDESIAYDKLQHNMDMLNKIPLRGMHK